MKKIAFGLNHSLHFLLAACYFSSWWSQKFYIVDISVAKPLRSMCLKKKWLVQATLGKTSQSPGGGGEICHDIPKSLVPLQANPLLRLKSKVQLFKSGAI